MILASSSAACLHSLLRPSEISRDFGSIPKKMTEAPHLRWISATTSNAGIVWVVNKPCSTSAGKRTFHDPGVWWSSAASTIRTWVGCEAHAGPMYTSGVICPSKTLNRSFIKGLRRRMTCNPTASSARSSLPMPITTKTVAFCRKLTSLFNNRFAFLIMRKLKLSGHLNGILRTGLSALCTERAIIQIKDRAFFTIDLMHDACPWWAITCA